MTKSRSKSSAAWLREHFDDHYVKEAQSLGLRSRAAFKLMEIQAKDRLIKPGMMVVDLGSAPGGWSEYVRKEVGRKGRVIASDILMMDSLAGVEFIQGDFTEEAVFNQLMDSIGSDKADLVISDMAPNFSGVKEIDQPNSIHLVEIVLEAVEKILRPGGSLIVKCFEGSGVNDLRSRFRKNFQKSYNFKPNASNNRSRESFLIGRNFVG